MKSVMTELQRFPNAELVWCQEEPKNMGGWTFVDPWIELTLEKLDVKAKRARYAGRPASASTAKRALDVEALEGIGCVARSGAGQCDFLRVRSDVGVSPHLRMFKHDACD
jgi:hypothetical protein